MQALFQKIETGKYQDRNANAFTFKRVDDTEFDMLEIELGAGSIPTGDLDDLCKVAVACVLREQKDNRFAKRQLSISGRLPGWAVAALHHSLKPYAHALYQFDPKLGHVMVMNHQNHVAVGTVF